MTWSSRPATSRPAAASAWHSISVRCSKALHPSLALDDTLVQLARDVLLRAPVAERLYGQLKSSSRAARLKPIAPLAVASDASGMLRTVSGKPLTQAIPGLFSLEGYLYVRDALDNVSKHVDTDRWVLGMEPQLSAAPTQEVVDQLLRSY